MIPTLTNVLPELSSFIRTKYNDLGSLAIFFFFSCDFLTNFNPIYSFAFSKVENSFMSLYGFTTYFLNLAMYNVLPLSTLYLILPLVVT